MNKHTPGPWQIKRRLLNLSEIIAVGDADGWFVADCHTTTRPVEEVAANAYLIAAVPDLLAACEEAERILGNMGYTDHEGDAAQAYDQLRAVIAKAIGAS